jgi:23S rRNA (guanosine2251-2'-O)-methyltransferase
MKLNAKQLRSGDFQINKEELIKNEIYIILDNILDTYNIGAIFRVADAVGAQKVILCEGSLTPPNHRILKSSVNTTEVVEWSYSKSASQAIKEIRKSVPRIQVVAIEQSENSISYDKFEYKLPLALVLGHESTGVSKKALKLCDGVVELPMYGLNVSMNVMVSLAIVSYKVLSSVVEVDSLGSK